MYVLFAAGLAVTGGSTIYRLALAGVDCFNDNASVFKVNLHAVFRGV